jgi:hypothetical protein
MLVVVVVTMSKLVKTWRMGLPFKFLRNDHDPEVLTNLNVLADRLRQWNRLTLQVWALVSVVKIHDLCKRSVANKESSYLRLSFAAKELSAYLAMFLFVVPFAFLVRWHILIRIESVQRNSRVARNQHFSANL